MKSNFNVYLEETKLIEESAMSNPKRLQEAIELKKLFAIPWLLASDVLFSKHDFLVRVYGHTEVKRQQERVAKKPIQVNAGAFLSQIQPLACSNGDDSMNSSQATVPEFDL